MRKTLIIFISIGVLIISIFLFKSINISRNIISIDKLKSANLSTDYEIDQALKDITELKLNTVNVPIVIEIPNLRSNEMKIDEYSKEKAITLIKKLKKENIKIILEPYPWINSGGSYETEYNPINKEKFFRDWKKIIEILVNQVANKYNVDIIVVASNLTKLESYEAEWIDIIDYIKSNFNGLVTYKTSWWYTAVWNDESINKYNEKLNNKIFSKVDFISIAAYFELSQKGENTVEELVSCLNSTTVNNRQQNVIQEIYKFYEKYNKEIFFGELGFPRENHAATEPWNSKASNIENNREQARCFEAYKEVFEKEKFIKGFSVFAIGEKSSDKKFYPSKESKEIIISWYNKE